LETNLSLLNKQKDKSALQNLFFALQEFNKSLTLAYLIKINKMEKMKNKDNNKFCEIE